VGLALAAVASFAAPESRAEDTEPPGETPPAPTTTESNHETAAPFIREGVPHPGSDQILWVPTFHQALEAGKASGRLVLVMGSVGDWRGY
jgi:hypothetical protein